MNDGELRFVVKLDDSAANASLDKINSKTKDLSNSFKNAGRNMTLGLTTPITALVTVGVNYNAQMEQFTVALTTLTGSAEEAASIMETIKKDAAATPFDVASLVQANQLLISTGLEADEARETILALGDAVSSTGGGSDELSRMAVNLQQIKNLGKASALDIKQFAFAGIDIYGLLADYLGITKEEAAEMEVSWDNLNGALIQASKDGGKYFNGMANQSKTLTGRMSTLKDEFYAAAGALTESLLPFLTELAKNVTNLFTWFSSLDESQRAWILTILGIVAALGPLLTIIGNVMGAVQLLSGAMTFLMANPIIVGIMAVVAALMILYDAYKKVTGAAKELEATTVANQKQSTANIETAKGLTGQAESAADKSFLINLYNSQLVRAVNAIKDQEAAITKAKQNPFTYWMVKDSYESTLKNYKAEAENLRKQIRALGGTPKLATGTNNVQKEGLAYLHEGEAVVPKKYNPAMGGGQQIVVNLGDVVMDGKSVGRIMTPYITKTIKVGGGNV